jgi:hypothetical protein
MDIFGQRRSRDDIYMSDDAFIEALSHFTLLSWLAILVSEVRGQLLRYD